MKLDGDTKALRSIAIGAELDRLNVPHPARQRIHARLMRAPFPSGDTIQDQHAKRQLVRQAAASINAESQDNFPMPVYQGLRERGILY